MNPVEIEEAVSSLAGAPFDPEEFPFAFLEAFGNKPTTIKKLKSKSGSSNQSDIPGGVLQRNNIHLKVCPEGEVTATLTALRDSPATARYKAKFILATDGKSFEAENLADGETIACAYPDFHDHFGFFLPLAGITIVKQIRENAFDIKATGRLNRLLWCRTVNFRIRAKPTIYSQALKLKNVLPRSIAVQSKLFLEILFWHKYGKS